MFFLSYVSSGCLQRRELRNSTERGAKAKARQLIREQLVPATSKLFRRIGETDQLVNLKPKR